MGVFISGSVLFGCVFNRDYFEKMMEKLIPDFKESVEEYSFVEISSELFSGNIDVYDSVDLYTGEDWRKEICVYLVEKGAKVGMKGGDSQIFEKENFVISQEEEESFVKELKGLGFTNVNPKWIFRTFLD